MRMRDVHFSCRASDSSQGSDILPLEIGSRSNNHALIGQYEQGVDNEAGFISSFQREDSLGVRMC